ncbi:beta-galactosidase [Enterococcus casseliflavus]|uniref:beta-galactosidase n=1 Tax=Enterococcus casseliflavus TaxID=37734 RepID=UPI002DC0547B|nr:beta-galactosidase [Enterococcus casseliflavus]MEB6145789.1 beta-galactosidase [Enterococcus casseliflavus]
MSKIHYGVAYYDEYMPYDRLQKDIEMMKEANINAVRIAESTWSTHEPQEGVFDFQSVHRVLDAMHAAGIDVIVGTPTYAVPTWLVKKYPEVLVTTKEGKKTYGARQIMDITNPQYLYYSERIIRKLIEEVIDHPAVIGFQVDNETKHYGTAGENVQIQFQKYVKEMFSHDLEAMNQAFGLSYWSNRINAWEDFPSVNGTINGSLGSEFSKFQRKLVTEFLTWQVSIVNEYKKDHQFVMHNFDFEWRGYSFGIQPDVNHFEAAKPLDITGIDVYHPSQDELTGREISFAGDVARTTKDQNYFVVETEAQAFKEWVPYENQLRLQAFSHIASGASMICYWHWHSIHNSAETYWKGLLSHDLQPNPVYNEAKIIGSELKKYQKELSGLQQKNQVAFVVSNESLTAINDWFPFSGHELYNNGAHGYNDIFRQLYDELYNLNVGADVISVGDERINRYKLLIVPALYTASDTELAQLNQFVENGGHILYTFKSGFTDEHVKVRTTAQPGYISEVCGVHYQQFVKPKNVTLSFADDEATTYDISEWMELLVPTTAETIASYNHQHWGKYAAITKNHYGKGTATYIGCFASNEVIRKLFIEMLTHAQIERPSEAFPVIIKNCLNEQGQKVSFYFNYSNDPQKICLTKEYFDLFENKTTIAGTSVELNPWDVKIFIQK